MGQPFANHSHKATVIFRIMYLWQHSGSNFCGSTLAQMPGGFDIAIEHICIEPFVDLVDYGRLEALSRFGAYTVTHGTAVADLEEKYGRMRYGLEMALQHIAGDDPFLHLGDYGMLIATSRFGADTVSFCKALELWYDLTRL